MSMSPEFEKRLRREIRLALREMRYGCVECLARGGYCPEHHRQAVELILHPRKVLNLKHFKGGPPS